MRKLIQPAAGVAAHGKRSKAWLGGLLVSLMLAACGGGGGDSSGGSSGASDPAVGPPAAAATLTTSTTDAAEAAKAAVTGADGLANRYTSMTGFSALLGVPIAAGDLAPVAAVQWVNRALLQPDRVRALEVRNVGCIDVVDPPCSGAAVFDTNIADNATGVSAGQYLDVQFNAISGMVLGKSTTMTGRMRIEFLSALNLSSQQLVGVSLRLKFVAFAGTVAGVAFGPVSDVLDLTIDGAGVITLTAGGARYGSLGNVTVTAAGTYTIGSGSVRAGFGSNAAGYADLNLQNWRSSGGRPVVNSVGTLTAGAWRATVRVTASSATAVVYAVTLTVGNSTVSYRVTATYPAGGGAPTYLALPVA